MVDRHLALTAGLTRRWTTDLSAPEPDTSSERLVRRFGIGLVVAAVVVQTVAHLVDLAVFDLQITLIDADADGGVFSWASVVATASTALLLALVAAIRLDHVRPMLVLSAVVAFLSLDDAVQLHERVSELKTQLGPLTHFSRTFWPLVFMPLLVFTFVGLAGVAARMHPTRGRLMLGGLVMLAVAIVLEMGSPLLFAVGLDHGDLGYELEAVVEEGLELAGWMLCALALALSVVSLAAGAAPPRRFEDEGRASSGM